MFDIVESKCLVLACSITYIATKLYGYTIIFFSVMDALRISMDYNKF